MRQLKIAAGALGISSCFLTFLMYYWHRSSIAEHRVFYTPKKSTTERTTIGMQVITPIPRIEDLETETSQAANLLDTPGCKIPMNIVDYTRNTSKSAKKQKQTCGRRAVFLKKIDVDKIQVLIKAKIMKKYLRKSALFDCCARFFQASTEVKNKVIKNKYTACKKIFDGITITMETDFVNVKCHEYDKRNVSRPVYDDVYAFAKKQTLPKLDDNDCESKYNVLMLGMDSMSLNRILQTMPRTSKFLDENSWLGYRGYHKIGDNTFPNLMAVLSGKNMTHLSFCSGNMDRCNKFLIWRTFKENGYVTAYGEDYLRLPDTFSSLYEFQDPPTDHYMRPFFLKGETELNNKSLVCTGRTSSGQQLLNYALDFADTYRSDRFFGVFWMNSFSHNINSRPQDADKMFENFFIQLSYSGVLENTFVIFFSDHGLRFGELRFKAESYYDERLPFLFFWHPFRFKGRNPIEYKSSMENQYRLVTHFDLYNTLMNIYQMSICSNFTVPTSLGCPNCQSLFETIRTDRSCKDVNIHEKWCSCHSLSPLDPKDTDVTESAMHVVSYIKNMTLSVKTKHCWGCMSLYLKKIIRVHFYYSARNISLYYVVAFSMYPGNVSYEATLLKKKREFKIIGPVSVISPYRGLGKCTVQPRDRLFCVCQKIENC